MEQQEVQPVHSFSRKHYAGVEVLAPKHQTLTRDERIRIAFAVKQIRLEKIYRKGEK